MSVAAVAQARRRRLAQVMREAGLEHLLLFGNAWQNDYLRYAADFGILEGEGVALVGRDGSVTLWLDDELEAERAGVEAPDLEVRATSRLVEDVNGVLGQLGNAALGLAPRRHMPVGIAASVPPGHADATGLVDRLLMVKTAEELDAIRRAAHLADEGYAVFCRAARAGRKDYELVAETEAFFRANGVDDNFMLIGSGGPELRGMTPPSGRVLRDGDHVITELTPCVDGYYVQICRTLVLGEPNPVQQKAFDLFHRSMMAGIEAVRPGATAADIAKAENDVFRADGLGDYVTDRYTRVRGHGLGLFPDTKPHILENVDTPIEAGMVLIVHPNTFHPEAGYLVLGDAMIVGDDGPEILTTTPRKLFSTSRLGELA
jgi:Xaa-Pro aminopeptidase